MKLFKHKSFDSNLGMYPVNVVITAEMINPFVWALVAPSVNYSEATTVPLLIEHETELITQRQLDGRETYISTLAELRVSRLASGEDHETYNNLVYIPLSLTINQINIGGWISAYEDLNNTATNAIFTVDMKKSFRLKLSNYIVNSGNYEEYNNSSIDADGFII